jgi:hypothetical protein
MVIVKCCGRAAALERLAGGACGTQSWADPELDVATVLLVQQPFATAKEDMQRVLRKAIVA